MELKEQWIKWEPLDKLDGNYYMETVINSCTDGFKVIIGDHNNEKKKIYITFKFGVFCHRDTYELFAWPMQKDFLCGSYFYKVINSKYIQWLSEISDGISADMQPDMQHFVIFTEDSTLEILHNNEPTVEFVNLS